MTEIHLPKQDAAGEEGPFGLADASRSLEAADFVAFEGFSGIATRDDDLRARVIVGRKGAGKTLYLRRARAAASENSSVYADNIQQNLPSTTDIVSVANLYSMEILVEKWMSIWRAAILRSVASHMLNNKNLRGYVDDEQRRSLREDFPAVMLDAAKSKTPLSVYSQVSELISPHRDKSGSLDRLLSHRQWEELEYRVGELLIDMPPFCLYLDAVDEEFRHAPAYWLMCQKGLFYQVMRLLRDTRLGGRLHIFICIRDLTYTSVFGSEHATRYLDPLHIRLLEWDSDSISYLFEQKIARLGWPGVPRSANVAEWLGIDSIHNERRGHHEATAAYVLRHTRLLPRDVVVLGNELVARMMRRGQRRQLTGKDVRQVVRTCARVFGGEQLAVCANQIASDMMHAGAGLQEVADLYTGSDPDFEGAQIYIDDKRKRLGDLIKSVGCDRFDRDSFLRLRERGRAMYGGRTDPLAVLWQNGLLGIEPRDLPDGRAVFYSASAHHELWIDDAAPRYAFHPCLIDALNLTSEGPGSVPVTPVSFDEI
ncbi:MAG: P-loop ATPase, Sll1717 family [Solirubrobacteraceae bacterium]